MVVRCHLCPTSLHCSALASANRTRLLRCSRSICAGALGVSVPTTPEAILDNCSDCSDLMMREPAAQNQQRSNPVSMRVAERQEAPNTLRPHGPSRSSPGSGLAFRQPGRRLCLGRFPSFPEPASAPCDHDRTRRVTGFSCCDSVRPATYACRPLR